MRSVNGTTLKCVVCGNEIKGGFYNSPRGAHCCQCWKKVPQTQKDQDLIDALEKRADIKDILREVTGKF